MHTFRVRLYHSIAQISLPLADAQITWYFKTLFSKLNNSA